MQASKILIVDDDPCSRRVLQATLSRLGYATRCAEDGRKALTILTAESFDLIIIEILLPEMDGIGLIIATRELADIPKVIAVSAGGAMCGMDVLQAAELWGADVAMAKPLSMSSVVRTVAELLDVGRARRTRSLRDVLAFGRAA